MNAKQRIKKIPELVRIIQKARKEGKRIVTTNGCFDILHIGHARYLEHARAMGDMLIVGINSDRSVRSNKGPKRPIVPERERAEMLAMLKPVDFVFIFDEKTPEKVLGKLKPDIHIKGGDRHIREIIEKPIVEKYGGKVVIGLHAKSKSTTDIIEKIISAYGD